MLRLNLGRLVRTLQGGLSCRFSMVGSLMTGQSLTRESQEEVDSNYWGKEPSSHQKNTRTTEGIHQPVSRASDLGRI